MAELEAEAARTAEQLRQQALANADVEARAADLQAKLAEKTSALHSAQEQIAELDQERDGAAARAAARDQELADVKVCTCAECMHGQKAGARETCWQVH